MNTDKIYAESIAKEYAPKDNSKIVALRKLDAKAKMPATVFTYTFGIGAALVFGTGMCLAMQVIGGGQLYMILGIFVGIVGVAVMLTAYPTHKRIVNRAKAKYGPRILELSEELSGKII